MSQKDEFINVRTTEKSKTTFSKTLSNNGKTQSYIINLLIDAYNKAPLQTLISLEQLKINGDG